MNERKFDHGSRINTGDEGALERLVGANIFESLNDGLVSEPVTPSAAAPAAFALRIDGERGRDILLDGFVRSPHRHDPRAASPASPLVGKIRQAGFFLRRCSGADVPALWRWVRGRGCAMRVR